MESQEIKKFEEEGGALIEQAKALKIIDQQTREEAAEFRANVNTAVKKIQDFFKPMKQKAHEAWKTICNQEADISKKFVDAKIIVDQEIQRDYLEQKRIQDEAEKKARAEAAEAERRERERLLKLAEKQMDQGKLDKAEETIAKSEQVFVPTVNAAPAPQKTVRSSAGTTSMINDIDVEVTDLDLYLREVLAGRYPKHTITVDLGAVKKWVKANHGIKSVDLPGLRSTVTARVSSRAG